jgi:hypothetical protein
VERGLLTEAQVGDLLATAAERQRDTGVRRNREAAVVLDRMAKAYAGKFMRGMPMIHPAA